MDKDVSLRPRGEVRRKTLRRRPRPKVTLVGVLGELLITAGVLVLAFLGWQLWLNDIIVGQQLAREAQEQTQEWDKNLPTSTPTPAETERPPLPPQPQPGEPPVMTPVSNAQLVGYLLVPRWGEGYYRPVHEGIGTADVLNRNRFGRYPTTQMPGEIGNFAIAAHRKAYGGNLEHINSLEIGDNIYVETEDGWYRYVFRNLEFVTPSGVGVLDPVPQRAGEVASDRIITLTSCNPLFSTAERIIAYGLYDGFFPRAGGAPEEIAPTVLAGR